MNLKPLRRILKYISLSLLGLILFLILFLFVGLNMPFVQKRIGKSVAKFLERKIDTPVNIDKVAIHLFDRVALHGVYFEDQKADTLLATSDLVIDIDLKKLLKKTVEVDKIIINDLTATMRQQDSIFNFQYIIDAFAPKKPKPKKENPSSPWTISLKKLELNNTHALLDLKSGQQDIALKSLHVNLKSLDLEKMDIALNSIAIESVNYVASFTLGKSKRKYDPTIFPLSTVPIKVTAQKLSISNSYVDIITGENDALGTTFNPQHIQAKDLNIDFKNVYFDSTRASLTAKNISTEFGQQIDIQHLSGNLIFSDKETGATNLELKTGQSEANLDASLTYDIFKTFILFEDDLQVDIKGKPINLHADELSYFIPALTEAIDINQLPSKNIRINTSISGDLANFDIKNLDASIGETKASISGIVKHPTQTNRIQFNAVALTANASTKDIEKIIGVSKLPIDIKPFGRIDLASKLSGNLKELQLEKFTVKTGLTTNVDFAGTIQNLDQIDQLQYNLNINKIETASNDVIKILDSIPAIAKNIEFLTYSGQIAGSLTSFNLDGEVSTNLGKIFPDLKIDFNEKYTNAVYKGDLKVDDFQLGRLLGNDSLGNVTLTAKVDGRGLSLDTIDTQLDVNINSIVYNSYNYHDLNIEGCFYKKEFEGDINFNDENLAFDFNGKIGLNNEIPNLNFTMKLDTLNLDALHLSKTPLSASMVITSNLSEATLNNMNGEVKIRDIRLSKEGRTWETDSIAIIASNKNNGDNEVLLASEIINGSIIGDFSFVNVAPAIMQSLDEYFPFSDLINTKKGFDSIPEQSFKGEFYVSNPKEITNFFTESNFKLDTAILLLDFNSREDIVDIDLQVPEFTFGNNTLKNIAVISKTNNNQLSFTIASDSIIIGNSVQIPYLEIGTSFKENMGTYGIKIKDEEAIDQFALTGKITTAEKLYEIIIDKSVVLDAKNWRLNMNEPFVIGKGEFEYPAFDLMRGDQGVFLTKGENKEIDLYFEAFEASNITNFILNDSTSLEGSINGSLKIATLEDPMTIEGDLYIGAIQYNDIEIGSLGMEFQNIGGSYTTASIDLSDLFTNVHIDAILSEGGKIDGEVDIKQFQLKAIEPFLRKYVKNVTGDLAGKLIIGGSLKAPDVDGTLSLNDAGTEVISLGSYYTVKKGDFDISKDNIDVKTVFVDSKQRVANLTGNITHNYFSNIGFNLNFSAESFTFLDSKKQKNLPFYGLLNAELDADITGTINKPEIFAVFATDDSTDITIEAITNNSSISNEPYIIFVDNGDYTLNEIDSIISLRYKISTIFDLTVYANINDEAKLKVVIDPISGDYLDVIGNGNMVVDVNESGQLLINGNYEVSSGQYRFTFEDFFLKRFFEIVPGGQITFVGDIMSSKLDLAAAYKLKTSTYSLIENEFTTLSEDEKIAAKKPNTEVNVVLSISGELNQPQIDFDIKIPQNTGNTVSSSVARALEKLRSNKTELNTQVFSLLLLQGFTTINSTSSDIAYNASSQIAFSSVSSFLNNQLKKLTNKAKGLEVGVGIASTANDVLSGDAGSEADNSFAQSTNIDVFIKQSLLNDRLILELGTNLDLNSGNSEGGLTNVAGDFVLEYKLTKEGNLRLNVFQKSDYSLLNDNNVWKTGIGLSYQKTFGKLIKRGSYKQTEEINKDAPIENKKTIPIEIPSDSIENKEAPKSISK